MTADVVKNGGYVVAGTGGPKGSIDSKGYAVFSGGAAADVAKAGGNVVLSNPASVLSHATYTVLANPSLVTNSMAYAVAANTPTDGIALNSMGYAVIHPFYPPYEDLGLDFSFMERRFPECVSFGSQGGPGFKTSVFEFDSGFTAIDIDWERLRARYDVTFDHVPPEDIDEIETFFYGMKGRAIGFRYKDFSDYQISNQNVFVGDGETTVFQVFKRYSSGQNNFDRIIKKTVGTTMSLYMDGVELLEGSDFFMLDSHGQIVFTTPPVMGAVGTIQYCEFDVPVRFDTDTLSVSYDDFHQLNTTLPLIEVLV